MDIFSHGLWGDLAVGRKSKNDFWTAFAIGMLPDLITFGLPFLSRLSGFSQEQQHSSGHMDMSSIPDYVFQLYNITHSLIIFAAVFAAVWIFRKKPQWLLGAWGLHILVDIPTHDASFFPTPFLWPISDFKISGINWGDPIIFFPNLILLAIAYSFWAYFYFKRKRQI